MYMHTSNISKVQHEAGRTLTLSESGTISRLAYRWKLPFLSTSASSSQDREATTLAMVPDYQRSLAKAISLFLNDIGVKKVTVIHTEEFRFAALSIENEMMETVKLLCFSKIKKEPLTDVRGVILVLADEADVASVLHKFSRIRESFSYTRIIVFSNSREEPGAFFTYLNGVMDDSISENSRRLFLASIVLLHPTHNQAIADYAMTLNLTSNGNVRNSLLLCDAISILDRISDNDMEIEPVLEKEFNGFTGPIFFSSNGARLPYLNGFIWEWDQISHAFELTPSEEPCNDTSLPDCNYYAITYRASSKILSLLSVDAAECEGGACGISYAPLLAILVILGAITVPLAEAEKPGYRKISATSSAGISTIEGLRYDNDSPVAYLNDQKVFIKAFRQRRAVNFTKAEMKQLNQLKTLANTNINTFIGMSFNQRHEMLVVWKHCSRGSLDEIIFEKNHRFGRTFQGSFLKHILNGLQYLHNSPIQQHGSLFLSNCVVDAHWVVKLTDFGVQEIIWDKMDHKELSNDRTVDVDHLPIKYFQLPQEILRNMIQDGLLRSGNQKADIYQLGMIIYQILFHVRPYAEKKDMNPRELMTVIYQSAKENPCYPSIPEDNKYTLRLVSIMQQGIFRIIITDMRFCIFGDTVNMACHMAGSSEPGKIQVTEGASRIIRQRYPQFNVEERGLVDVKGKGPITTYWLTGRTRLQTSS
ncbi:hypothetical protein OESDEN_05599 [Oesophagostomum dentatum]|uniref:guanylate cyclase n=1 Tax=Oesophagostomum dentatum TaxID=61180 RepID=A0A0B1TA66_OESDE|nr:hypothetical protein OESDEN_05599 [Oesophagostomum dentatum]